MSKPNGAQDEITTMPVLQPADAVDIGIVSGAEGGERLVSFQIKRLGVGFAMSLADCATAANALAHAARRVLELNQEDAEKAGSSILIARH
jgi:hypothetical protein